MRERVCVEGYGDTVLERVTRARGRNGHCDTQDRTTVHAGEPGGGACREIAGGRTRRVRLKTACRRLSPRSRCNPHPLSLSLSLLTPSAPRHEPARGRPLGAAACEKGGREQRHFPASIGRLVRRRLVGRVGGNANQQIWDVLDYARRSRPRLLTHTHTPPEEPREAIKGVK